MRVLTVNNSYNLIIYQIIDILLVLYSAYIVSKS